MSGKLRWTIDLSFTFGSLLSPRTCEKRATSYWVDWMDGWMDGLYKLTSELGSAQVP